MSLRILLPLMLAANLVIPGCFAPSVDPVEARRLSAQVEILQSSPRHPTPADGLSLDEAIDYALKHNLSIRAAELEYAIEHEIKNAAALKMLPSLQANLGFSERNRYNASSSESLRSGEQSLVPSFSSEKNNFPTDLTLMWSLMDFGLSFIRGKQAAEREIMAGENLRRLRQQIVMDATIAYYRLRAADDIAKKYASIEEAVRIQLDVFKEQVAKRNMSQDDANKQSLPLLVGLKGLRNLSKERQTARINLAKAMGAPRPEDIVLRDDDVWSDRVVMDSPIETLYEIALQNRPELYRADASARISHLDAKAALLQIAPNVNLSASLNHNPDKYLVYHNWMEAGVRASWDLFRLPLKFREARSAKQRAELSELRVKVAAASILVQINLALLELDEAGSRLELLEEIADTRHGVLQTVEDSVQSGNLHGADALAERIRYINDYASLAWGRSDYMAAYARLVSGLGLDPNQSVPELCLPKSDPAVVRLDADAAPAAGVAMGG